MTQENQKIKIAASPEPGEALDSHLRPVLDYLTKTKGSHEFPDGDQLQNMRYYREKFISGRYLDVDDIYSKFEFPETIKVYDIGISDKKNAIEISLMLNRTEKEQEELAKNMREANEKLANDPELRRKIVSGIALD